MTKQTFFRVCCIVLSAFLMGLLVANFWHRAVSTHTDFTFLTQEETIINNQNFNSAQYEKTNLTADEEINVNVYRIRNKSVVNITTEVLAYNWFFEPVPQEGGIGSGSIIDEKGYILTNHHVIEQANKVYVTLWDGHKIEGKVIGIDQENDLAVIEINPRGVVLEAIPVGDSAILKVGQKVLAIGNPFGLDRTLTTGIISGLGRPIRSSANIVIQNMIQTDASINPGNSGGPLLNSSGDMIGVNTIIVSPSRGSVGVGFAVPSRTVKRIIPDLIKYGKVKRGWIEWSIRPLFFELVKYANMPVSKGLLVTSVEKRGNADKAGIKGGEKNKAVKYGRTTILLGGDIIVKVNGQDVSSVSEYLESLEQTRVDDTVEVEFYRNKHLKTATITLRKRPDKLVIE